MQSKNTITFGIVVIAVFALMGFLVWSNNSSTPPINPSVANSFADSSSGNAALGTTSDMPATIEGEVEESTSNNTNLNSDSEDKMENTGKPEMTIDLQKQYSAVMHTSEGDVTIDLFENDAPVTVNNFVHLSRTGFYDGLIFHRVIEDFMVQGGDPTGTGSGNPGYSFEDEFNNRKIVKGSLAMANSGPNTNGSQFFIVTADATPWLDGKHTNFGRVTAGMDIIEAISKVDTDARDKPLEDITIESIDIIEE